jgi:hypothetical protein
MDYHRLAFKSCAAKWEALDVADWRGQNRFIFQEVEERSYKADRFDGRHA